MSTKAKKSLGIIISIESEVQGVFTKIGELTDIPTVLGDKSGKIDVTSFDSVGYKEFIGDGLKEAPEVQFKGNWIADDDGQLRIFNLGTSQENTKLKIVYPDAITIEGTGTTIIRGGYVSNLPAITAGKTAALGFDFSFQFSGSPQMTMAS
ncbi:MAG: hypothetical protein WA080_02570 [Sulfuricurvum sp.]